MKTATKILSMFLLVAMCLSLMGGSAYASGLAPLGDDNNTQSSAGSSGIYGLAPLDEGTVSNGNASGDQGTVSNGNASGSQGTVSNGNTIYGLFETDGVETYSALDHNWVVGANVYKTLSEALAAVGSGGTITLNASVNLDSSVTINKNVTIDLKGNTLTLNGNQIYVSSGYTLNLQNGTVVNMDQAIANVDGYLNLYSITASSATFTGSATSSSNPCRIQIYNDCNFSGSVPDSKYMAPGFTSDGSGNTKVYVARIGSVYYDDAVNAINAAKDGETVTFITDTSVAADIHAYNVTITKNITLDLGGNSLQMNGSQINNANVTVYGTTLKGDITCNNGKLTLGSGTSADGMITLNGGSLTINGGTVKEVWVNNDATLNMASGTINSLGVNAGTLNVSGGTVESFVAGSTSLNRAITGGQWKFDAGQLAAFQSAIANGYEAVQGNPYYTVRKIGDSGSSGNDGNFNYIVYGSPYTRNSNGSVYVDISAQSTNGYWVGTNSNASNATKLPTTYYSLVSNVYGIYNYRLTFTNSYLNSLANGTYYIFAVYNGNTVRMGSFVVQGDGSTVIPGTASVWPVEDTWYSGSGMYYFYVTPGLKLVDGTNYSYYDVVIDGMQIGGDKLSYNGYQKFGVASSVMDTLATGTHSITVLTTAGYATGSFRVGATLRPVDTDKHVIGSSKNLQFVCSEAISRVWVGGVEITNNYGDYYTLSSSGKTITLSAAFLNNRTAGQTYTLTVQTAYGDTPSCTFQILTKAQASGSPQTGDESNLALWAAVLILSGGAAVAVLPKVRKMKSK